MTAVTAPNQDGSTPVDSIGDDTADASKFIVTQSDGRKVTLVEARRIDASADRTAQRDLDKSAADAELDDLMTKEYKADEAHKLAVKAGKNPES